MWRSVVLGAVAFAAASGAAACHADASHETLAALRPACAEADYWNGTACVRRGDAAAQVTAGVHALAVLDVDIARTALDAADHGGPLAHATNITLWEQRGI